MLFLTDAEIYELTGKRMSSAQCRALDMMCVRYLKRPDGRPKIARAWVEGNNSQQQPRQVIALDAIH